LSLQNAGLIDGRHHEKESSNGQNAIESDIETGQFPHARKLGWLLMFLGYLSGPIAFWYFYNGFRLRGGLILIIAGVLAHASFSFITFEHWLFF
jgi:hypothetical protein